MSWVGFTEKLEGNSSVDLSESPGDFTHILDKIALVPAYSLAYSNRFTRLGDQAIVQSSQERALP